MARLTKPAYDSTAMGRSRISSPSKDAVTDNGTALISVVHGEQIQIQITVGWMTSLAAATISVKVVEGNNDGAGTVPSTAKAGGQVISLTVLDVDNTDNIFKFIVPENLITAWATSPLPDKPVYGFIGVEIDDGGVGTAKQVWKPLRGLVEVLYSPTEAS